jgi:hypothetical protein
MTQRGFMTTLAVLIAVAAAPAGAAFAQDPSFVATVEQNGRVQDLTYAGGCDHPSGPCAAMAAGFGGQDVQLSVPGTVLLHFGQEQQGITVRLSDEGLHDEPLAARQVSADTWATDLPGNVADGRFLRVNGVNSSNSERYWVGTIRPIPHAITSAEYTARVVNRARLTGRRNMTFSVGCPAESIHSCTGRARLVSRQPVRLAAGKRKATAVLASASFSALRPGHRKTYTATLSKAIAAWLAKTRDPKLLGRVENESPGGVIPTVDPVKLTR